MIAILENDIINVYRDTNILIGGIKTLSDFNSAEIEIGEKKFQISRNKWKTEILEDGKVLFNLKTNSFSGHTEIIETEYKISGVFGLKWGTKLTDKENNTLVKIRNENQFINTNRYDIETSNGNVTDLDLLLTLYGHLYGSNMKLKTVIVGGVVMALISIGILNL